MKLRRLAGIFLIVILLIAALPAAAAESGMNYIVRLESPLPVLMQMEGENAPVREISSRHNLYLVTDDALVDLLRQEGMLVYAEPDYPVELMGEDSLPELWHLEQVDLEGISELGCYGQGVRVAVIDSGAADHVALQGNLLPGYNYLDETTDVTDNIGHGTFVAGLIAAEYEAQNGLIGAAHKAQIVPLKCFDNGVTATVSTICRAIYDAADTYDCRVINMSFGLRVNSKTLQEAIDSAAAAGVVMVASAGNDGTTQMYYPAAYDNVIGVGAVDENGTVAAFSQRNESVLVTAPGKDVCSTDAGGGWSFKRGTSFSAPLVSAVVARLLNIRSMTANEAVMLLAETATDCGDEGYDTSYGYGLVNPQGAMEKLLEDAEIFLSPAYETEYGAEVVFSNLSWKPVSVVHAVAAYENGQFCGGSVQPMQSQPYAHTVIQLPMQGDTAKYFLWQTLDNPTPLMPCREYTK